MIHYQFKAFLHGKPTPFNWEQIQRILHEMEPRNKQISNLQRNSEKYWLCKYYQTNSKKLWDAMVLDCEMYNYALNEYKLEIFILENATRSKVLSRIEYSPKEIIQVKVSLVEPFENKLEFEVINQ